MGEGATMEYIKAFVVGGLICMLVQIPMEKDKDDAGENHGVAGGQRECSAGFLGVYEAVCRVGGGRSDGSAFRGLEIRCGKAL